MQSCPKMSLTPQETADLLGLAETPGKQYIKVDLVSSCCQYTILAIVNLSDQHK